jgi:hypothetical protein
MRLRFDFYKYQEENMKRLLVTFILSFAAMSFAQETKVGEDVSGQITVGKAIFALPPGKWHVVAERIDRTNLTGGGIGGEVKQNYLVQRDAENRFLAALFIRATISSTVVSSWSDATCNRKDTLHRDTLRGNFNFPECLLINHLTNFWGGDIPSNEFDKKIWHWFKEKNVKLPFNVLSAIYTNHFAGDQVRYSIQVNTEINGLVDIDKKTWGTSPWHVELIKNDPKRLAYFEEFKKWTDAVVKNGRGSLRDTKPLDSELPALPSAPAL